MSKSHPDTQVRIASRGNFAQPRVWNISLGDFTKIIFTFDGGEEGPDGRWGVASQELENIQHVQMRIKLGTASPCWAEHSFKTVSFKVVSYFLLYMNSWYRSSLSRDKVFNSTSGQMEVGNEFL